MKKNNCSIKKRCFLVLNMVFLVLGFCVTAQAKTSATQVNALYRNFLSKSSVKVTTVQNSWTYSLKDVYFKTFDVDQDGVNELIIKQNTKTNGSSQVYFHIYIYSIKNGKVSLATLLGGTDYSGASKDEFLYASKFKAIPNIGENYAELFTKKGIIKLLNKISRDGKYYIDGKQVSAKKYNSEYKKYFSKNCFKSYKLYKNTKANRSKYLKNDGGTGNSGKTTIKLSDSSKSIYIGQSYKLKVSGTSKKVKWASSNSNVASVSSGKVTAKKAGTVTITASVNGKKLKCKITVKSALEKMKKELPQKGSWWNSGWKNSLGFSGKYVLVGNTYGKRTGKYKIKYVQVTSYGYFIKTSGYYNFRWYRSDPYKLQCYSEASGNKGYSKEHSFSFYGC